MYIYIIMILISTFFISISEICEKKNKNKLKKVFVVLGLFFPIIMAAYRKIGVGTDTRAYISLDFFNALKFDNLYIYNKYSENEFLYLLINFIVSKFTANVQVLFGIVQSIVVVLMYYIAVKQKDKAPIWFTYIILMLIYYNKSLNMLRQLIACFIILYAFPFLEEKKYKNYCFFVFVALGFHITAIFGFFIAFIYILTKEKKSNFYIILIVIILGLLNYTNIITLAVDFGFLNEKYLNYITTDVINISTTELLIKIAFLLFILFFSKGLCKKNKSNRFYIYMMIIDVILYSFGNFCSYAERFAYYFGVFQILNLVQIPLLGKDKKNVNALRITIVFIAICYSYLMYGVLMLDETVPYILYFN